MPGRNRLHSLHLGWKRCLPPPPLPACTGGRDLDGQAGAGHGAGEVGVWDKNGRQTARLACNSEFMRWRACVELQERARGCGPAAPAPPSAGDSDTAATLQTWHMPDRQQSGPTTNLPRDKAEGRNHSIISWSLYRSAALNGRVLVNSTSQTR